MGSLNFQFLVIFFTFNFILPVIFLFEILITVRSWSENVGLQTHSSELQFSLGEHLEEISADEDTKR